MNIPMSVFGVACALSFMAAPLTRYSVSSTPSTHMCSSSMLSNGPGIGEQMPTNILATAVRERMPSFRELGVTYVLLFFKSADPVSRQALPFLDGIAQRFGKKVSVVAISDEPVSIVREFASSPEWAPKLGFVVAADPTRNAIQTVFGQGAWPSVPAAFIFRGGVVQWRGAPVDLEAVVNEVVNDRWDIATAKRAAEQQRLWDAQMESIDAFTKAGRFDEALRNLDEACQSAMPAQKSLCSGRKFSLLITAKRTPEAIAVGEQILRSPTNDKQPAGIAWTIVNVVPGDPNALAFAMKAAEASDKALRGRDAMVGAILARVQFLSGRSTEAAATVRRALSFADSPDVQNALREDLRVYEPAVKPGSTPAGK